VRLKEAEAAGQKMRLTETRSLNQPNAHYWIHSGGCLD
jgi:hypothetical protein